LTLPSFCTSSCSAVRSVAANSASNPKFSKRLLKCSRLCHPSLTRAPTHAVHAAGPGTSLGVSASNSRTNRSSRSVAAALVPTHSLRERASATSSCTLNIFFWMKLDSSY